MSYRDAYKSMLWFEKYGEKKNLIQNHLQVVFNENAPDFKNQHLILISKNTRISLPLDEMGRTVLPLLKSAYDENAELILDLPFEPKSTQASFLSMISIKIRLDNNYDSANLLLACEQALKFQHFMGVEAVNDKHCKGVYFIYSDSDKLASIKIKSANGEEKELSQSTHFLINQGDTAKLKKVSVLLEKNSDKARVMTKSAPLAILPIIE